MGDGAVMREKGLRICTDSFSTKDVILLMNVLIIKYRLSCTLHKNKEVYRIYIPKSSMVLLVSIVKPHMVPSMLYKIGL
jgi:hypothetical protein